MTKEHKYTIPFDQCDVRDYDRVGGKCSSLARMISANAPVPPGFAITTDAYCEMLDKNGLRDWIQRALENLDPTDVTEEEAVSKHLRAFIETAEIPEHIETAIRAAYARLSSLSARGGVPVAVRSSATAEDLPGASFAGQQDTFLWIVGADELITHVRKCWSSLYTARAIAYRKDKGFPHEKVYMSVGVQKMVNAKAAGVAMTLNPMNGDRSKIVIDSSWGLGETVVSGTVTPDNFVVDKVMLAVCKEKISKKHIELIADLDNGRVIERPVEDERQIAPSLSASEVMAVATIAKRIEKLYGSPQDIEWAIDADLDPSNNVVILQSRPETVWSSKPVMVPESTYQTGLQGIVGTLLTPVKTGVEVEES